MLTDDFLYHPNCRNMHMATHVDEGQYQVVFLYKLIPGVAESSHGTRKSFFWVSDIECADL